MADQAGRPLRILLLEDNPDDEFLVRRALERSDLDFELRRVDTREGFVRELDLRPDVILADHMLPDFDAPQAVAAVRETSMDIPVIVVSGTVGEETAVAMMQAGADDYLLKDRLVRIGAAIRTQLERRSLRAEAVEAARRAEEEHALLQAVTEQLPGAVWTTDTDLRITFAAGKGLAATGLSSQEMVGLATKDVVGRMEPSHRNMEAHRNALRGKPDELEVTSGDSAYVVHLEPLLGPNQEIVGVIGAALDVTERREAEDQLRRSMAVLRATDEHRRQLLRSLSRAQDEERRRIAEGIHDDTVQIMAGAAMRLSSLRRQLGDRPEHELVAQIEDTVQRAMGRLRHLIFELRPTSLDRGLAPALREYAETVGAEEAGPEYHVEDSMEAEPSPEIRGAVYRIVVEALRNVRSHARAHRVDIAVATEEGGVQATVRDDGVGFDVDEVARSPGHVGLTTMRDRAETLGGRFEVQSEPGRGSTVTIWVPEAGEDGP